MGTVLAPSPSPWALDQLPASSIFPGMTGPQPPQLSPSLCRDWEALAPQPQSRFNCGEGLRAPRQGQGAGETAAASQPCPGCAGARGPPGTQPCSAHQTVSASRGVWGLTRPCIKFLGQRAPALQTLEEDRGFLGRRHTAGRKRCVCSGPLPPPSPSVTDMGPDGCCAHTLVSQAGTPEPGKARVL